MKPQDDDLLMGNTELSVFMPRKYRQSPSDNDVTDQRIQLDRFDVNCELEKDRISVTVEFLQPFNGIAYSKGHKDDPACKYV